MLICHSKKFVILAPWKTASSTLHARLHAYDEGGYSRYYYFNPYLNRIVHQHITCAEFACLPESKLGYKVVAFVRNPYDRVYSGFIQLQRAVKRQPNLPLDPPWVKKQVLQQLAEVSAGLAEAAFDFNRWAEALEEFNIYDVGRNTSFPLYPAKYWTHIGNEQFVDFIGRVETFEQDFVKMIEFIGVTEEIDNISTNVLTDPSQQNNAGYKYIDRISPRSIAKIDQLFAQDFDTFNYPRAATINANG